MEVSLGKAKSVSPFQSLYKKYDFSVPAPKPPAAVVEEEKKGEVKAAPSK